MPFTFSHPAVILPLTGWKRNLFSATGLIIGSMTPDFEYFIRLKTHSEYSHSFLGILWFDLPLALLLCFIYHGIVRNALIKNSPEFVKSRMYIFNDFNWPEYFAKHGITVIISLLIGILSHVLWDGFTHQSGCFVLNSAFFNSSLQLASLRLPVYRWLEHLSTLIGGVIVLIAFANLKKYPLHNTSIDYRYWLIAVLIALSVAGIKIYTGLHIRQYEAVFVVLISAGFFALILTPLLLKFFIRTKV